MQSQKRVMVRAYDKRVKSKNVAEVDLVWKVVLPIGTKDQRLDKWSPRECPFIVDSIKAKEAYQLRDRDRELHAMPINRHFLKKTYYPMAWGMREERF